MLKILLVSLLLCSAPLAAVGQHIALDTNPDELSNDIFDSDQKNKCQERTFDGDNTKMVCVCNAKSCAELQFEWPTKPGTGKLVVSSKKGRRFESSDIAIGAESHSESPLNPHTKIKLNLERENQEILGFGGAFTDATGHNIASLPSELADKLLQLYFGKNGLQYSMGRVPIAGTDFSMRPYSYDDVKADEQDIELKSWKLQDEDTNLKIPYLKRALQLAKQETNTDLRLFASPWSPPKWMKQNKNIVRGHLVDSDEIYRVYAEYLMRFFDAYESNGIKFWGATVQNEPMSSYLPFYFFNSMQMSNEEMIKFIKGYLGPALEKRGKTRDKFKLIVGDDALGLQNFQVPQVLQDSEVSKYVSGAAYHWYNSGLIVPYSHVEDFYNSIKDKVEFMIMSEACNGYLPFLPHQTLGDWSRGEVYASDIIEDLNRHTSAWIDWNMALDMGGGPNWAANYVDSPIIVNAKSEEFYLQPMYYALAHFSRFIRPGSVHVDAQVKKAFFGGKVMAVAVRNKESGHMIVNILNKSTRSQIVRVDVAGWTAPVSNSSTYTLTVDAKSINSLIIKL